MSTNNRTPITKNNFMDCLKDLGKEYRKAYGKNFTAEIILIGGGAVLAKYSFRELTYDVDAILKLAPGIKGIASKVADKYSLPPNWLNDDFTATASFAEKLVQVSRHYRQFSNVLNIRIVDAEYLLAMKLMSGRQYKYDLSDIVGIVHEHSITGNPIKKEDAVKAFYDLYGKDAVMPDVSKDLLNKVFDDIDLKQLYLHTRQEEENSKELLLEFDSRYPKVLSIDNTNSILEELKQREQNSKKD